MSETIEQPAADIALPAALRELLAEIVPAAAAAPALTPLRDLGFGSLHLTRLWAELRRRHGLDLPPAELAEACPGDLADRIAGGPAAPGPDPAAAASSASAEDERYAPFPLTPLQQAYLVAKDEELSADAVGCHVYREFTVPGTDPGRIAAAWQRLVDHHDMLRATADDDGTQQVAPAPCPWPVPVHDLADAGPDTYRAHVESVRARLSHRNHRPGSRPLGAVEITRGPGGDALVHLSLDTLLTDAHGYALLLQQWHRLTTDPRHELPEPALRVRDCVLALDAERGGPARQQDLDHWTRQLADLPPAPLVTADAAPEPGRPCPTRRPLDAALDPHVWQALTRRARGLDISPTSLVLAVFAAALTRCGDGGPFGLAVTTSDRPRLPGAADALVGPFTSTALLTVAPDAEQPLDESAQELHALLWDALHHGSVSGIEALRELRRRTGATRPAPSVVFTSLLGVGPGDGVAGGFGAAITYGVSQTSGIALDHQMWEQDGGLRYRWDVTDARFAPGAVETAFAAFGNLLADCAAEPVAHRAPGDLQQAYLVARATAGSDAEGCQCYQSFHVADLDTGRLATALRRLADGYEVLRTRPAPRRPARRVRAAARHPPHPRRRPARTPGRRPDSRRPPRHHDAAALRHRPRTALRRPRHPRRRARLDRALRLRPRPRRRPQHPPALPRTPPALCRPRRHRPPRRDPHPPPRGAGRRPRPLAAAPRRRRHRTRPARRARRRAPRRTPRRPRHRLAPPCRARRPRRPRRRPPAARLPRPRLRRRPARPLRPRDRALARRGRTRPARRALPARLDHHRGPRALPHRTRRALPRHHPRRPRRGRREPARGTAPQPPPRLRRPRPPRRLHRRRRHDRPPAAGRRAPRALADVHAGLRRRLHQRHRGRRAALLLGHRHHPAGARPPRHPLRTASGRPSPTSPARSAPTGPATADPDEQEKVLRAWNATEAAVADTRPLHHVLADQARRTPDAVALRWRGGGRMTFGELDRRAERIARALAAAGHTGPGAAVALRIRRGPDLVAAVHGVLRAGAAYVPVEPWLPAARAAEVLALSGARAVLTTTGTSGWAVPDGTPELAVDTLPDDTPAPAGGFPPAGPEDTAYVLFTSGSTGAPKGVAVPHRAVRNLLGWAGDTFDLGPGDTGLAVTSVGFDLSVFDLFGLLGAGAALYVADEEEQRDPDLLLDVLLDEPVTFWNSAPTTLAQLAALFDRCTGHTGTGDLRLVFLSGDFIPLPLPDRIRAAFPAAEVVSLGGPTETTVWSVYHRIGEVDPQWRSIPYGRPIHNTRHYVLDDALRPCPVGTPGELYTAGACLATGFAGNPALTHERFLPDPFAPHAGERMYRTGDLAAWHADGALRILGRADHQAKIRGFRVEPGEIEHRLRAHPAIHDAVVLAQPDGPDRHLTAYLIPAAGAAAPTPPELRRFAAETSPAT